MVYTPPKFADFGKAANDLVKKEFDQGKLSFTHKGSAASGLTFEHGVSKKNKDGSTDGYFKSKFNTSLGKVEAQLGNGTNASVTLKPLVDNLTLKVKGDSACNAGVSATYSKDAYTLTKDVKTALLPGYATKVNGSVAVGFEGFALGGSVALDANKQDVTGYNLGAQYTHGDGVYTVTTANKLNDVNASAFYQACKNTSVAAKAAFGLAGQDSLTLTAAVQHKMDAVTVKAKLAYPSNNVSLALQQSVASAAMKVGYSATFNPESSFAATNLGISITGGDY